MSVDIFTAAQLPICVGIDASQRLEAVFFGQVESERLRLVLFPVFGAGKIRLTLLQEQSECALFG